MLKISANALLITFSLCSAIYAADEAVRFGRFHGVVLAIEDACPAYYSRTDPMMGSHLSPKDYEYAMSIVERERSNAKPLIKKLGCDEASKEVMKLTDRSYFEVWEIKEK